MNRLENYPEHFDLMFRKTLAMEPEFEKVAGLRIMYCRMWANML